MPAKEVLAKLRETVPPTGFEASEYPNRPRVVRYDKIVRFSTIPLVKAWLADESKGMWSLAEDGEAALARHPNDPKGFMLEAVDLYKAWKKEQPEPHFEVEDTVAAAAEASASLEEAEEGAFAEIRDYVEKIALVESGAVQAMCSSNVRLLAISPATASVIDWRYLPPAAKA